MESIGQRFKKLRLEKGLSLEEVQKKTKIHINILKALEEDSLVGFNPVYIKGFLKIYCAFLGVSPQEYIDLYHEQHGILKREKREEGRLKEKPRLQKPQLSVSAPSARSIPPLKFNSLLKGISGIKIKYVLTVILVLLFAGALFALGKFISYRLSALPVKPPRAASAHAPKQSTKIKLPRSPRQAAAAKGRSDTSRQQAKSVLPAEIRLAMRAKEDCWVDLRVDGRVVFHGILRKGKYESWQAKEKIEFSVGNAGVIDLELNGKSLPPLGRKGQTLKNIIITRDKGLVIPQ